MKVRLTPLSILVAVLISVSGYNLLYPEPSVTKIPNWTVLLFLAIIVFISDQLFRYYFKIMKRIWIVETCFTIFVAAIILLIQMTDKL